MKKLTVLTIIFILNQIFAANICFASDGNRVSVLSGSAWLDNNGNNIQELHEENVADVMVFVENVDTHKLITVKTDAAGFFKITNLSYGLYNVWSENIEGVSTPTQMIELDEVNGAALLDLVFIPADAAQRTASKIARNFTVFLPVVNN